MKKKLGMLGVVIGALSYAYMIVQTAIGTGEGVSLTTFGLWAMLAWITAFTMIKQGANPAVPTIFGVGATTTALILVFKGRLFWTGMDTIIAILVVLCVLLWKTKGAKWALVLSVLAAVIAGVPFMIMTWKTPASSPIIPNIGFLITNTLAFISVKGWRLEDRLYCGVNTVVCSLLVIPWFLQ